MQEQKNTFTGQRFGRLLVLEDMGRDKKRHSIWRCQCDCGNEIVTRSDRLHSKETRSCGCLKRELTIARSTTHGHTTGKVTRTYKTWSQMITRCENENDHHYPRYGGRGIQVCPRWHDFALFLADMGERPAGRTLDRIDNDSGYEPQNCRWATPKEQGRNRRDNRILEHDGHAQCMTAWAETMNINKHTLKTRLRRHWTPERALSTPITKKGTNA